MAKKKYLVIDLAFCHDCNNCFIACKDEHVENSWLPYTDEQPRHGHRWMNIHRQERGQYPRVHANFLPMPCLHCADPPCKKAYPDIMFVREDGIVMIDAEKAKGVKGLVDSCPYEAIWYNDEKDVPQKCGFCAHIIDGKGGASIDTPRCAHSCPTGSITCIEADEAEFAKIIKEEGLQRFMPEVSDDGLVWYKNLYRWTDHFIAGGFLKNGDCAEGVTVSLKGADVPDQVTNYFGDFWFDGLKPGTYILTADGKDIAEVKLEKSVNIGNIAI